MKEINNNIQESICSFEVSQLLKEKNFGVSTSCYYRSNKELVENQLESGYEPSLFNNSDFNENWNRYDGVDKIHLGCHGCTIDEKTFFTCYSAPTHSIALEWIRVNFGVHIRVERNYRRPLLDEPAPEPAFTVDIDNLHSKSGKAYSDVVNGCFDTPQEAIEAGLLYTLTNLIH